jgi:hypothetical protein
MPSVKMNQNALDAESLASHVLSAETVIVPYSSFGTIARR